MSYGKLITRFTTGGHDIFITCPAKSMHLEPEAGNYYVLYYLGSEQQILHILIANNKVLIKTALVCGVLCSHIWHKHLCHNSV